MNFVPPHAEVCPGQCRFEETSSYTYSIHVDHVYGKDGRLIDQRQVPTEHNVRCQTCKGQWNRMSDAAGVVQWTTTKDPATLPRKPFDLDAAVSAAYAEVAKTVANSKHAYRKLGLLVNTHGFVTQEGLDHYRSLDMPSVYYGVSSTEFGGSGQIPVTRDGAVQWVDLSPLVSAADQALNSMQSIFGIVVVEDRVPKILRRFMKGIHA